MSTAIEPEVFSKLGLANLGSTRLPHLEVVVRNAKQDIIASVSAQIVALIVSPQNCVMYLESVSTSDTGAHALMGSVSDPRGATGGNSRAGPRCLICRVEVKPTGGWENCTAEVLDVEAALIQRLRAHAP